MGSIGTQSPKINHVWQGYLDRAGGDEELALKDYAWNNLIPDTFELNGKEYEVLGSAGYFVKVVEEPTEDWPYMGVTVEVYIREADKEDSRPRWYTFKEYSNHRKKQVFYIRKYGENNETIRI